MLHPIDRLVEVAAATAGIKTGDLIATGTCHEGLGPIEDGDEVTTEIEGIGTLTVTASDPPAPPLVGEGVGSAELSRPGTPRSPRMKTGSPTVLRRWPCAGRGQGRRGRRPRCVRARANRGAA